MITAQQARELSNTYIALGKALEQAYVQIEAQCRNIKTSDDSKIRFMHDRCFETPTGSSYIADELRLHGYTVDDSDEVDRKDNNYRTIIITW
ncbi:hypothetical protein NVP1081O_271 [Vibrio phage 1.081.O._10N.286.52.C2]|nr:hypothetical protein NVP1081O_271 [Vibrio phage 1.081.O._10N.286.52.C2]